MLSSLAVQDPRSLHLKTGLEVHFCRTGRRLLEAQHKAQQPILRWRRPGARRHRHEFLRRSLHLGELLQAISRGPLGRAWPQLTTVPPAALRQQPLQRRWHRKRSRKSLPESATVLVLLVLPWLPNVEAMTTSKPDRRSKGGALLLAEKELEQIVRQPASVPVL